MKATKTVTSMHKFLKLQELHTHHPHPYTFFPAPYSYRFILLQILLNMFQTIFLWLKSCQIQGFQECCITWKYASLTVGLTVDRIQTFNCIGRVNNLSDIRWKLENRRYCIPVIIPAFHRIRDGSTVNSALCMRDDFQNNRIYMHDEKDVFDVCSWHARNHVVYI